MCLKLWLWRNQIIHAHFAMHTLPKIWRSRIGCDLHHHKYGPPSHLTNISCCQNIRSKQCIEIFWIFIICFWGATSCVTVSDKEFNDFPLEMRRSVTTGWLSRNVHLLLKLVPYGHRNKRKGFFCLFAQTEQNLKQPLDYCTTAFEGHTQFTNHSRLRNTHYILKTVKHVGSKFTKQ